MKKVIYSIVAFSMLALNVMPAFAATSIVVGDTATVGTSLSRGTGTGIKAPIIKAKFEMKGHVQYDSVGNVSNMSELGYDDDMIAPFTQIAPSGIYQTDVPYAVCAIVTDQGVDNTNISSVAARNIFFPENIAFHANSAYPDKTNGGLAQGMTNPKGETSPGVDIGLEGCGADMTGTDEVGMQMLNKIDGWDLFCGQVMNNNYNLPWFYDEYDYAEICAPDGELLENHAFVYCGNTDLWYEDPAGDYRVEVKAQTKDGQTDVEENTLTYLELQSFDIDFHSGVNYATVVNTNQWYGAGDGITDSGDRTFGTARPTLRNLGNVRLYIGVEQNDMGFGTTNGVSNIDYRARIGNNDLDWKSYGPNMGNPAWLEDILDLSEDEKLDLNVRIKQWPTSSQSWNGTMILSSQKAPFRTCEVNQQPS